MNTECQIEEGKEKNIENSQLLAKEQGKGQA